jgi:hypothetical protein
MTVDTNLDALAAQVRSHPPLPAERVDELLQQARRRPDGAAIAELVEHSLEIALDAAIAHRDHHIEVVDLFQEGSTAIIEGVTEYVASSRTGGLEDHLRRAVEKRLEAVTADADRAFAEEQAVLLDARVFEAAEVALRTRLGRPPTIAELAAVLEWSAPRVELASAMLAEARLLHDQSLLPFLDDEGPGAEDANGDGDGAS